MVLCVRFASRSRHTREMDKWKWKRILKIHVHIYINCIIIYIYTVDRVLGQCSGPYARDVRRVEAEYVLLSDELYAAVAIR